MKAMGKVNSKNKMEKVLEEKEKRSVEDPFKKKKAFVLVWMKQIKQTSWDKTRLDQIWSQSI